MARLCDNENFSLPVVELTLARNHYHRVGLNSVAEVIAVRNAGETACATARLQQLANRGGAGIQPGIQPA